MHVDLVMMFACFATNMATWIALVPHKRQYQYNAYWCQQWRVFCQQFVGFLFNTEALRVEPPITNLAWVRFIRLTGFFFTVGDSAMSVLSTSSLPFICHQAFVPPLILWFFQSKLSEVPDTEITHNCEFVQSPSACTRVILGRQRHVLQWLTGYSVEGFRHRLWKSSCAPAYCSVKYSNHFQKFKKTKTKNIRPCFDSGLKQGQENDHIY